MATLSFNLDVIPEEYDYSNLAIYVLDSNMWRICDTYIKDNFLNTKIDVFGEYSILHDENHET